MQSQMYSYYTEQLESVSKGNGDTLFQMCLEKIKKDIGINYDFYDTRQKIKEEFFILYKALKNGKHVFSNEFYNIYMDNLRFYSFDKVLTPEEEKEVIYNSDFKCFNCARKNLFAFNTSSYSLQTRSADESTTEYVTCHTCGVKRKE